MYDCVACGPAPPCAGAQGGRVRRGSAAPARREDALHPLDRMPLPHGAVIGGPRRRVADRGTGDPFGDVEPAEKLLQTKPTFRRKMKPNKEPRGAQQKRDRQDDEQWLREACEVGKVAEVMALLDDGVDMDATR